MLKLHKINYKKKKKKKKKQYVRNNIFKKKHWYITNNDLDQYKVFTIEVSLKNNLLRVLMNVNIYL